MYTDGNTALYLTDLEFLSGSFVKDDSITIGMISIQVLGLSNMNSLFYFENNGC